MTTPTINVNLKPCDCTRLGKYRGEYPHFATCSATPILIPCHIPRTVEMMVRVGECISAKSTFGIENGPCNVDAHVSWCPARPIRFTCTIGGDGTWAGSGVSKVDPHHEALGRFAIINDAYALAYAACRKRWAIVKALVTGHTDLLSLITGPAAIDLMAQRDAVFAALAEMAKAEQRACNAQQECDEAFPYSQYSKPGDPDHRSVRPSVARLAAYVSHLVATVGAL